MELTKKELEMLSDAVCDRIGNISRCFPAVSGDQECAKMLDGLRRQWQDLNTKICHMAKEKETEEKAFRITKATADYTGGGIYIFYGEMADGAYWMGGLDDMLYSLKLDADPTQTEESDYEAWQEEHIIEEHYGALAVNDIVNAIKYILEYKPQGNYAIDEIERRLPDAERLGRIVHK